MDANGAIYGTADSGGWNFQGVVFKLTPPLPGNTAWTETVLYNFQGEDDGWKPLGELVRDPNENLIGVTSLGTSSNFGAVFAITP